MIKLRVNATRSCFAKFFLNIARKTWVNGTKTRNRSINSKEGESKKKKSGETKKKNQFGVKH